MSIVTKKIHINSPSSIRRILVRAANELFEDKIDYKRANAITFACKSGINCIHLMIKPRIDDLEDVMQEAGIIK